MTVSGTWKRVEREIARFFGAERAPAGSNNRPDRTASDSTHEGLYIEVKYRQVHSVRTLWEDVKAKAEREGKVPVLGLADAGRHGKLIVVHEAHFDYVAECRERAKSFKEEDSDQ